MAEVRVGSHPGACFPSVPRSRPVRGARSRVRTTHPGGRRAPRRHRPRRPPTTSTACSARSSSTRPGSTPAGRSPAASAATPRSPSSRRSDGSRSWPGAPASKARRASPEREFNGPVPGWQAVYREGTRRARRRLPHRRPGRAGATTRGGARVPSTCCTSTRARARTARPSTAGTGTAGDGRRSSSRATSSRAATPTTRWPGVSEHP